MRSLLSLFLLISLLPAVALAQDASLYSVSVVVSDHSVAAREAALENALAAVLVRVSGDSDVNNVPGASGVREKARRLVRRFSYAGGGEAAEGEEPKALYLKTDFHPRAVNRAIKEASLPLWGGERPRTLIAVNMPDGFLTASARAAGAMKSAARKRGLPLAFPSTVDARGRLAQADLSSGSSQLASLLHEYDSRYALVGRIESVGAQWRGSWRVLGPQGVVAENWENSSGRLEELQEQAVFRAADVFSRQFAVRPSEGGGSAVVAVDRITGIEDYARVMNYLAGMTSVANVSPQRVSGSSAVFKLELAGSLDNFRRGMNLADWLTEDSQAQDSARSFDSSNGLGYRLTR